MRSRTRWGCLAMMFVVLAGCRREETPGSSAAAPPAPEARVAAPPPAADLPVDLPLPAPAGEILVDVVETPVGSTIPEEKQVAVRVDAEALRRLLPPRPGLPVPLASVVLGKLLDEAFVARKTPLSGPLPRQPFDGWWQPPGHPGTLVTLMGTSTDFPDGRKEEWASGAQVLLPRNDARRLVTGLWGEPSTSLGERGEIPVWIDDAAGFQARLLPSGENARLSVLEIFAYLPLDRLVGAASDRFGFESSPYLGKTVAEVLALVPPEHRPHAFDSRIDLALPSVELDDLRDLVQVMLFVEEGRVTNITMWVPDVHHPRAEALAAKKGPAFHVTVGSNQVAISHE